VGQGSFQDCRVLGFGRCLVRLVVVPSDSTRRAEESTVRNNIAITAIITAGVVALVIQFTPRTHPKAMASAPVARGMSQAELFNLNGKCAQLTEKMENENGSHSYDDPLTGDYKSHYNPRTNRCYALITLYKASHVKSDATPDDYWDEILYDAQTHGHNGR
jgi:hypothetical protein